MFKKLFSLTFVYSLGAILQRGIYFFLLPLITERLTIEEYAVFGLLMVIIEMVVGFLSTPITAAYARHYYAPGYENKKSALTSTSLIYLFFTGIVVAAGYYFSSDMLADMLSASEYKAPFKLFTICLVFYGLSMFLNDYLKVLKKAKFFIISSFSYSIVYTGVCLYGLLYMDQGIDALIYATFYGKIVTLVLVGPYIFKKEFKSIRQLTFDGPLFKEFIWYGSPLIISSLAVPLINYGDRYLLTVYTSLTVVGIYTFGSQISKLLDKLLLTPILFSLTPLVFEQEKDPDKIRKFISDATTNYFLFGFFIALILVAYTQELIMFMGSDPEYAQAWYVSIILAFGAIIRYGGHVVGKGILLAKKTKYASYIVASGAFANVVLNIVFIELMGWMGAAVATIITYLGMSLARSYFSKRLYDIHLNGKRILHLLLVGLVSLGFLFYLARFVLEQPELDYCASFTKRHMAIWPYYVKAISIKTLALLVYPLLLLVTGYFSKEEKKNLSKLFKKRS